MSFEREILRWVRGNEAAADFLLMAWHAAQEWDDIEDDGRAAHGNAAISWLAFGKEYHPFFAAHAALLRPLMLSISQRWRAANVLDRGSREDVEKALMLRAGYYDLIVMCAWIVGGDAWAETCAPEIYRMYGETVESLWKEMNHA